MKQFIIGNRIFHPNQNWMCFICKSNSNKEALLIHRREGDDSLFQSEVWVCSEECYSMYILRNI